MRDQYKQTVSCNNRLLLKQAVMQLNTHTHDRDIIDLINFLYKLFHLAPSYCFFNMAHISLNLSKHSLADFPSTFSAILTHLSFAGIVPGNSRMPVSNCFYYSLDQSEAAGDVSSDFDYSTSLAAFGVTSFATLGVVYSSVFCYYFFIFSR